MTIKLVTNILILFWYSNLLYIILALFKWIIKQYYKNEYIVTGDWNQSDSTFGILLKRLYFYQMRYKFVKLTPQM